MIESKEELKSILMKVKEKSEKVGLKFNIQVARVVRRQRRKKESEVALFCPTLGDPIDCSLLGSSVLGIFQARFLEWVAVSFSRKEDIRDVV